MRVCAVGKKFGPIGGNGGGGGGGGGAWLISVSFIQVVEMQFQNCYSLDI